MVVTQHVKNISTLSESQNAQLERAMKVGDKHDEAEEKAPAVEATVAIRDENGALQEGDCRARSRGRGKYTGRAVYQSASNLLRVRRSEMRAMRW